MGRPLAGLLLAFLVLSPTTVSAEVIWLGDFETGDTSQWKGAPKDGVTVVKEPVREGKYALRIDGTNAAQKGKLDRIEFQHQPKEPGTAEGTERYFGWSVYLPRKLTDATHSLGYFETRNSWNQLMSFEVKGEDILFTTRQPYTRHWSGKGKMTAGNWHDFALHVVWSRDPKKGLVEVWFDGEKVVPLTNTATLRDENVAFFQIGLLRETSDVPETIIIDHVIEATTLEDVAPAQTDGQTFQKTVQPFLARHCYECPTDKQRGDVRLDQFDEKVLAKSSPTLEKVLDGLGKHAMPPRKQPQPGDADSNRHTHDQLPVLVVGTGNGSLKTGRRIDYSKDTPVTNLLLAMLDRVGVRPDRLGDSTGQLEI